MGRDEVAFPGLFAVVTGGTRRWITEGPGLINLSRRAATRREVAECSRRVWPSPSTPAGLGEWRSRLAWRLLLLLGPFIGLPAGHEALELVGGGSDATPSSPLGPPKGTERIVADATRDGEGCTY